MAGELVNQVKLAGIIKKLDLQKETAWGLVDCDTADKSRPVTFTVFKDEKTLTALEAFGEGDYIQIVGHCRAWSQKIGETWQNGLEIRIDEIKNPKAGKKTPRKTEERERDAFSAF